MDSPFPTHPTDEAVIDNSWASLRRFTDARIGLGRAGVSIPTKHLLEFQLAHARAQDAVHKPLDITTVVGRLEAEPWCPSGSILKLHSQAVNRTQYLQRPDYGRLLDDSSKNILQNHSSATNRDYDLAIAIVDGLSAIAIESNAKPFLESLIAELRKTPEHWTIAPLCVVEQGRVAIGDIIGQLLQARCVIVLIGERPGLSSPDSMGLYMTWNPRLGRTDAQRNCISNIRPAGLHYQDASHRALYLLNEARTKKLSGIQLKDRTNSDVLEAANEQRNFLTNSRS